MRNNRMNPFLIGFFGSIVFLAGCSNSKLADVEAFVQQEENKRGPRIEPLPSFPPYVSSIYSAAGLKSPFDPPQDAETGAPQGDSVAAPDTSRTKEFLERFNIAELKMVGTMEQEGTRWALINDGTGSVHRVKQGNYMGRNHGVIKEVQPSRLEMVEVVVDGTGGWIERPRSISMATQ